MITHKYETVINSTKEKSACLFSTRHFIAPYLWNFLYVLSFFSGIPFSLSPLIQTHPLIVFCNYSSLWWFYSPVTFDCTFHLAMNHELPLTLPVFFNWIVTIHIYSQGPDLSFNLILNWRKWIVRGQTNWFRKLWILPSSRVTHPPTPTNLQDVLYSYRSSK